MRQKFLYVYILSCADDSFYTGVSNNPERRVEEHNIGFDKDSYTYNRRPVKMVYWERFTDYALAISWEKKIKRWSRKKKEALIKGNWERLREEAKCKNETNYENYHD